MPDTVSWRILEQYVYMVFVSFHAHYIPVMLRRRIVDEPLYVRIEPAMKKRFSVLRDKDQMHEQLSLVMPTVMVAVFVKKHHEIPAQHVSATKEVPDFERGNVTHVVGIDRGLRFLEAVYDSDTKTSFVSGKTILAKRRKFDSVRTQLQSKGTKSAKRRLQEISRRENRWMSDVNHQMSKALVRKYGPGTLFTLEDLEDVSTDERNFKSKQQTHDLRSWAFYDLETKLSYKAAESGSGIVKVDAYHTSQRCPRCGRVQKENRIHARHEYVCDQWGFRTNDDCIGAMNIWLLGTLWVSGDDSPTFRKRQAADKTDVTE